jgi:hypothetical protein
MKFKQIKAFFTTREQFSKLPNGNDWVNTSWNRNVYIQSFKDIENNIIYLHNLDLDRIGYAVYNRKTKRWTKMRHTFESLMFRLMRGD